MQKVLIIILVLLGIVTGGEIGYLAGIKKNSSAAKCLSQTIAPSPSVVSSPAPSTPSADLKKYNIEQIYKDIAEEKTDVLPSSTLTNTYQGKIVEIERGGGVIKRFSYRYQLWLKLQGERGNTKSMVFTDEQIGKMEKQGFKDVSELKIGDAIRATLIYTLVTEGAKTGQTLISSQIVKIK